MSSYDIYWDNASGSSDTTTFDFLDSKSHTENKIFTKSSNLNPGSVYQFYVIAVNTIGESPPSEIISIMAASLPQAPTTFTTVS